MPKKNNLIGASFGRLLVFEETSKRKRGCVIFKCLCDCGNTIEVRGYCLKNGHTKSCGCWQKEARGKSLFKHGQSRYTPEYTTWRGIKERCLNSNNPHYINYGGRGIKVCDRWLDSFENFFEDMGKKPSKSHSLDRIDNDEGYYPQNCRWATRKEQNNNQRSNRLITYNGETKNLQQWADQWGISRDVLKGRLRLNWPIEKILTTPSAKKQKAI